MSELLKLVGEKIRRIRESQGLSQEQLAEKVNINRSRISNIERGKVNMTLCTLEAILKALNIHVGELFNFSNLVNENEIKEKMYLLELHYANLNERSLDEIEYVVQSTSLFLKAIDTQKGKK